MTIAELIKPLHPIEVKGEINQEVTAVTDDSRQVTPGSLFVAIKGEHVDGRGFLTQAHARGAVGTVVERSTAEQPQSQDAGVVEFPTPLIIVRNTREALGLLAARLHGDPSKNLRMIGVTGTNGKTTVSHLIRALVEHSEGKTGVLGTIGSFVGNKWSPVSHTTPSAVVIQAFLATLVETHIPTAIVEVSSHALALERVIGCEFDIVIFTNLTQDHLDFHGNMEDYFLAKQRLFTDFVRQGQKQGPKRALINGDDAYGPRLVRHCSIPVWTYSINADSDLQAHNIHFSLEGSQFSVRTPIGLMTIQSHLIGLHNVYNLLAAVGVGLELGFSLKTMAAILGSVHNVPGRFERVDLGQEFTVVVDYAHTDDALARLLMAGQSLKKNRIITVFGCGGDRDPGKRPKMGKVAVKRSDWVIVTSDNPRTEDPLVILRDIEQGILEVPLEERSPYQIIPDRREAIECAIREAHRHDLIFIAGKGHEDYQLIGKMRLDFDDREVAKEAIQKFHKPGKL